MKPLRPTSVRDRHRFEHLSYRLRTWMLTLAGLVILISLVLAAVVFGYILNLAIHPEAARELIDQWAQVFVDRSGASILNLPTLAGPARWFAVFTLGILAFLLTRIPLLLLQMGTQMFMASTYEQQSSQDVLRTVLAEIRQDSTPPTNAQSAAPQRLSSTSSNQEYP